MRSGHRFQSESPSKSHPRTKIRGFNWRKFPRRVHGFGLMGVTLMQLGGALNASGWEPNPMERRVEWRVLDVHQGRVTLEAFRQRLGVFSPRGEIYQYLQFEGDNRVRVFEDVELTVPLWEYEFSAPEMDRKESVKPEQVKDLLGVTPDKPLTGARIAIDPGHIGGEWANVEERYFRIGRYPPVQEGNMTQITANYLRDRLVAAGAEVFMVKESYEPATRYRPEDFVLEATEFVGRSPATFTEKRAGRLQLWYQEFIFYRIAEIYARARLLAEFRPDYTLCIHYNAAPWGRRGPSLFRVKKLVAFVHGSYTPDELESPTQKFDFFRKVFENPSPVEFEIADVITREMERVWQMPPEDYESWLASDRVNDNPYIWSRNVLANRAFPGPVIFLEGPYMNDRDTFYWIQEGDYEGERDIRGVMRPSLFRQFADITADALVAHYRAKYGFEGESAVTGDDGS